MSKRSWGFIGFFVLSIVLMLVIQSVETNLLNAEEVLDGTYWGIFEEGLQHNQLRIDEITDKVGKKPASIVWYIDWTMDFPKAACERLYKQGILPTVTWEAWRFGNINAIRHKNILQGEYDDYLEMFGQMAAEYGKPVMVRWGHEMNSNWYPWSGSMNGNSYSSYVKTYRYVHDKVVKAGGSNIIWVWNVNHYTVPAEPVATMAKYYPGDEYVDWIAIDGYNWGTSQSWSSWQSFTDVFKESYSFLAKKYPNKPMMIGEVGCASMGGDKPFWLKSFFEELKTNFPRIKMWFWFNTNKETDWRFDPDETSLKVFREGMSDAYILTDGVQAAVLHTQQ